MLSPAGSSWVQGQGVGRQIRFQSGRQLSQEARRREITQKSNAENRKRRAGDKKPTDTLNQAEGWVPKSGSSLRVGR